MERMNGKIKVKYNKTMVKFKIEKRMEPNNENMENK